MLNPFGKLAGPLFQDQEKENYNEKDLKELTDKYPFFSPGQLLYTKYLREKKDPAYDNQAEKAALYFNNPLWFSELLSEEEKVEVVDEPEKAIYPQPEESNNDELIVDNTISVFSGPPANEEKELKIEFKPEKIIPANELVFEPYHTVDYFASQGIRQQVESKTSDRFGQQLKSFTDWLKTIRKMTPVEIAALTDSTSEEKVVKLASDSIENNDVETEAMADVWIKQGEKEKAIIIYNKLSLKNPSKSSYFAGLIENLKTS